MGGTYAALEELQTESRRRWEREQQRALRRR
jgi:hypothetical protein